MYGAQVLFTGTAFKIFAHNYIYYYFISLVLKVLAAFSFYLTTNNLSSRPSRNKGLNYVSLTGAMLLLVGYTGIQTTDFFVQVGVYLSTSLSFLSIYFLTKGFKTNSNPNFLFAILTGISSVVISPYRLFAFILIFPVLSVFLGFYFRQKNLLKTLSTIVIWIALVFVLWLVGSFSSPGKISPSYLLGLKDFLFMIKTNPYEMVINIFQWLGVVIIPDQIITNASYQIIVGLIFFGFCISYLCFVGKKSKNYLKIFISLTPLLFFFLFMFAYNSSRQMSSQDRYLIMIFSGFCFLITLTFDDLLYTLKDIPRILSYATIFILITLVLIHFASLQKLYKLWNSNGRSATFIKYTEKFFKQNFNDPIDTEKIVFLDFDNSQTLYYVQYGLDFKLLVMSNTLNQKHFPTVLIDKASLYQILKSAEFTKRQKLIDNTFRYSFKNGVFSDSSQTLREDLKSLPLY